MARTRSLTRLARLLGAGLLAATLVAGPTSGRAFLAGSQTAAAAPVTLSNCPTMHLRSYGECVAALQQALNALGLGYHLTVDRQFGKATDTAVRWFQRFANLNPDGYVGPLTRQAIVEAPTRPCFVNDRGCAATLAAQGNFSVPVEAVYFLTPWPDAWRQVVAKVELRYSKACRCGWGLLSQAMPGFSVWVDISTPEEGGRTWRGLLGYRRVGDGASSTYTGAYNDRNLLMRACATSGAGAYCTAWY
jgi:Putative peptidoglycan binding domain